MKSVLFVSHGSRFSATKEEVISLVKQLKIKSKISVFEYAFLEIESPCIPDGIELCVKQGASDITILLNFLNSGRHVDEDIPRIINEAKLKYPGVKFRITSPVGQHPKIDEVFVELLRNE